MTVEWLITPLGAQQSRYCSFFRCGQLCKILRSSSFHLLNSVFSTTVNIHDLDKNQTIFHVCTVYEDYVELRELCVCRPCDTHICNIIAHLHIHSWLGCDHEMKRQTSPHLKTSSTSSFQAFGESRECVMKLWRSWSNGNHTCHAFLFRWFTVAIQIWLPRSHERHMALCNKHHKRAALMIFLVTTTPTMKDLIYIPELRQQKFVCFGGFRWSQTTTGKRKQEGSVL